MITLNEHEAKICLIMIQTYYILSHRKWNLLYQDPNWLVVDSSTFQVLGIGATINLAVNNAVQSPLLEVSTKI